MIIVFSIALVLHVIFSIGEAGQLSWWNHTYRLSLPLLILVVLITINPVKILRYAWIERRPNSDLLVLSVLWLGITLVVSIYEILVLKRIINVSRVVLFFGAGVQGSWGFANYLHLDHIGLN